MNHFDNALLQQDLSEYTEELEEVHLEGDHALPVIPGWIDMIDILHYIFNDNILIAIRAVQQYVDGDPFSVSLIESLREDVPAGRVCVICLRRDVTNADEWNCYTNESY